MSAADVRRRSRLDSSIARRAVDLALDTGVPFDDAVHHLCRLAHGECAPIDAALRELLGGPLITSEEECACLLLCRAAVSLSPGEWKAGPSSRRGLPGL